MFPKNFRDWTQIPNMLGKLGMNGTDSGLQNVFGDDFWKQFQNIGKQQNGDNHPYNLYENEQELLYVLNLPGISNPSSIDVRVIQRVLRISGIYSLHFPGFECKHEALPSGSFEYTIDLPSPVRLDKIEATYDNGLLHLKLYKLFTSASEAERIVVKKSQKRQS